MSSGWKAPTTTVPSRAITHSPRCSAIRETPVTGAKRLPYCMMGVCFDCLAEIDGVPNRQACMVEVREGMTIRPQRGARVIETGAE